MAEGGFHQATFETICQTEPLPPLLKFGYRRVSARLLAFLLQVIPSAHMHVYARPSMQGDI